MSSCAQPACDDIDIDAVKCADQTRACFLPYRSHPLHPIAHWSTCRWVVDCKIGHAPWGGVRLPLNCDRFLLGSETRAGGPAPFRRRGRSGQSSFVVSGGRSSALFGVLSVSPLGRRCWEVF